MNMQHVYWAQGHDWYRGHFYYQAELVVQVEDGFGITEFTNFDELKAWAGY